MDKQESLAEEIIDKITKEYSDINNIKTYHEECIVRNKMKNEFLQTGNFTNPLTNKLEL